YQHFRLYRWDESSGRLILVKSVARAEAYEHTDWHTVTLSLGEGISGIAAQSRRALLVPDASVDSRMVYPKGTTRIPESIISVPMVTGDRLFGVLSLARTWARSLSDEDLRVMESIAAQTALALANAEQYAEAEQTIKALATIEALQPTDAGQTDREVDNRIIQGFVDLSQADFATLRVLQADGHYHVEATGGRQWPDSAAPTGGPLTADQVAWLSDPRVMVYVSDPESDAKLPDWARRGTQLAGVKASIFLPMRAGQRFVGFVGLYWRRPRWLRPEQLRRLQLVAAQAAIAVETRKALERERGRAEALVELDRRRPGAARHGRRQPAAKRRQIQCRAARDRGHRRSGGRPRPPGRQGPRNRHSCRGAEPAVREVLPGQRPGAEQCRRHRHRALPGAPGGRGPRGQGGRRQPARPGIGLRDRPSLRARRRHRTGRALPPVARNRKSARFLRFLLMWRTSPSCRAKPLTRHSRSQPTG